MSNWSGEMKMPGVQLLLIMFRGWAAVSEDM
jgi:hypothetical protein